MKYKQCENSRSQVVSREDDFLKKFNEQSLLLKEKAGKEVKGGPPQLLLFRIVLGGNKENRVGIGVQNGL